MDRRRMTVAGMSLVAGMCSVGIMASPARAEDEEVKGLTRIDRAVQLTDAEREQVRQILQDSQMRRQQLADQLKALMELQGLDGQIYQLKKELRLQPEQAARLKSEFQQQQQGLRSGQ